MPIRLVLYVLITIGMMSGGYFYWVNKNSSEKPLLHPTNKSVDNKIKVKTVHVLSTSIDLPTGTLIEGEDLIWVPIESGIKSTELDKYYLKKIASENDLDNFVVRKSIQAGQPILKASVIKPGDSQYLASVLTPGMRAVSVPIDPVTGNSGLIKPGNVVDVILTTNIEGEGLTGRELSSLMSKTILGGVRVLAINQSTENLTQFKPSEEDYGTATLETSAKQAEILTVARRLGRLSLSVRSAFEEVTSEVSGGETLAGDVASGLDTPIDSPDLILMHGIKRRNTSVLDSAPEHIAD
ncbi:Flp pilus assembly protein CpaB [Vibrio nigripulchritudo ATCC 27043]|uniref:Flp pilus assembly protein CpaB n=1 Tax=Vibrio nigripulchritudo TaxID=28173 RepID=UPI00021C3470|nr:Flp pilus assembly protein CpaB [Vibrio nigripulchritudo]EGU60278.1 Flp pilus assembly protein CpaB [Vibrio nigripulchritudo ATCC 27043]